MDDVKVEDGATSPNLLDAAKAAAAAKGRESELIKDFRNQLKKAQNELKR